MKNEKLKSENDCIGFADQFRIIAAGDTITFNFTLSIFNSLYST